MFVEGAGGDVFMCVSGVVALLALSVCVSAVVLIVIVMLVMG